MKLDIRGLQRYEPLSIKRSAQAEETPRPPLESDLLLFGIGNSGEAKAARIQALFYNDGIYVPTFGINNDILAPRPLAVRAPQIGHMQLELTERLVLSGDHPRGHIRDYPLLEQRYGPLLRGIPVFETYPNAGHGGHGHPVISALDIDLHIGELVAFLRRGLRHLHDEPASIPGRSDIQRLLAAHRRSRESSRKKRIVISGGGAGSIGNAAHYLLPYLIRYIVAEMGIGNYELWGVILGPQAFAGLTPFVMHNYRALIHSTDHMTRQGQRRKYINDLEIDMPMPPYDRVFLLDDTQLPGNGSTVTEIELEGFLDQAALSVYLLLRGTIWETVAAHTANPDHRAIQLASLNQPRYLHTVRGALVSLDRGRLLENLATHLEVRMLDALVQRLDAS